jgi:hypothetical protein
MIDERTLPEHLDVAVAGASIDLHELTASAQRNGRRIRRRRRVATFAATSALTAGVLVGIGWLSALGGPNPLPVPAPPASSPVPRPSLGTDIPVAATGRASAAALTELVSGLGPGTPSDYSGDHTRPGALARGLPMVTVGALRWTPAGAAASVPIQVRVEDGWGPEDAAAFSCADPQRAHCSVDEGDGRSVVTYETRNGDAVDRFVDVWLQNEGLRVRVATSNARDIERDSTVLLDEPPLSFAELRTIALAPVWGPTIPSRYVDAGRALASYETARP